LDKLIPRFITLSARQNDPDITLSRMLVLLEESAAAQPIWLSLPNIRKRWSA